MNIDIILVTLAMIYGAFILLTIYFDGCINPDRFSALKIISYFSLVEMFVMMWFSFRGEALFSVVLDGVPLKYKYIYYVYIGYVLSIVGFLLSIAGAFLSSYTAKRLSIFIDKTFIRSRNIRSENSFNIGFFLLFIGVIFYSIFLQNIGGITYLWDNLSRRSTLSAGLGYYQVLYTVLTVLGGSLLAAHFMKSGKWITFSLVFILSSFILVTSGSRWFLGAFIFILILIFNFYIDPIRNLFNKWIMVTSVFLLVFMLVFVQFREGGIGGLNVESLAARVESDVVKRLGIIERQVVVVGYFNENDYWYGASYLGLFDAYRPRSSYPDKPPIDTGVYLKAISNGHIITPPLSVKALQATSWPEGNLAGYMNFGVFGFVVFSLFSGYILGIFYNIARLKRSSVGSIILFGLLGFMGAPVLSPYGVFELMKYIFIFSIVGFLSSITLRRGGRVT